MKIALVRYGWVSIRYLGDLPAKSEEAEILDLRFLSGYLLIVDIER